MQPASEIFVGQLRREYQRPSGELYTSIVGRGFYGHKDCVQAKTGDADADSSDQISRIG